MGSFCEVLGLEDICEDILEDWVYLTVGSFCGLAVGFFDFFTFPTSFVLLLLAQFTLDFELLSIFSILFHFFGEDLLHEFVVVFDWNLIKDVWVFNFVTDFYVFIQKVSFFIDFWFGCVFGFSFRFDWLFLLLFNLYLLRLGFLFIILVF